MLSFLGRVAPYHSTLNRITPQPIVQSKCDSSAHLIAARRLPVCAAGHDPASDPIIIASLPEAAWHLALAAVENEGAGKRKFKAYPIGYFHIDIAELRTAEGKLYLFVAIDRTWKFAFVTLHEKADRPTAVRFLEAMSSRPVITSTTTRKVGS